MVNTRKVSGLLVVVAIVVSGLLMTAAPADADTCDTPYCGGVVTHDSGAPGGAVDVANCWSDSYGSVYLGESPPCTGGLYSTNIKPNERSGSGSMWFVFPGQTTAGLSNYYDTDAFKVGANCVLNNSGTVIDRRGRGTAWYKITGVARIWVLSYRCF